MCFIGFRFGVSLSLDLVLGFGVRMVTRDDEVLKYFDVFCVICCIIIFG